MGCNCGKNKTAPAAAQRPAAATPAKPQVAAPPRPMKGVTQAFVLTTHSGRTQSFGSRLEAEAALVRAGGHGIIS